jgi:hypothetical protein
MHRNVLDLHDKNLFVDLLCRCCVNMTDRLPGHLRRKKFVEQKKEW